VLRLLTSGDEEAVQVLVWSAYRNREALGQRWCLSIAPALAAVDWFPFPAHID
jgi:hypothetical protein